GGAGGGLEQAVRLGPASSASAATALRALTRDAGRYKASAYLRAAAGRSENPGVGGSIPSLPTTFLAPRFRAATSPCEPATMRVPSANTSDGGGRGDGTERDQPHHVGSALPSATVRRLPLLRDHELTRRG